MANSITGINDDIISQAILESFVAEIAPLRAFNTDFSPDAAKRGDKVSILRTTTADASTTKTTHTDYTIQDADSDAVEISLGQPEYVSWGLDDVEIASSSVLSMEVYGTQKGFQLAKAIFQDILSVVTNANFGAAAFTGAASTFDADDVVDVRKVCTAADMPRNMRSLVLDEDFIANLLKDATIQDVSAFGSNTPIREGAVGRLAGFDVFESTLIPGNSENLSGFAAHPAGIAAAFRYLMPQQGHKYNRAEAMTDPSGITLGLRDWYDEDSGVRKRVMESVYGYAVGISAGIKRIVTA